jgi:hypothetical protein
MVDLRVLVKKLRHAADVIDELFYEPSKENKTTAAKIVKKFKPSPFNKNNPHWTQRPENKAKLMRMVKSNAKAKKVANG